MGPRSLELWSYMIGLAPVGEVVVLRRREAHADLNMSRTAMATRLRELIEADVIHRIGVSLFVVKARIGPCREPMRRRRLVPYVGSALWAKKREEA